MVVGWLARPRWERARVDHEAVSCRHALQSMATAQELRRSVGRPFTSDLEELRGFLPSVQDLRCPDSSASYEISVRVSSDSLAPEGYLVRCPSDHGQVRDGLVSWADSP